jgi:hypothetical protein
MIVIRTAEEMARVLASRLDPAVRNCLSAHGDRLLNYSGYTLEELGVFVIVQPGDTLEDIGTANPARLVEDSAFAFAAETIDRHGNWLELLFILSDDGFGLTLFVPLTTGTDCKLLSACKALAPHLELSLD